MNGKRLSPVDTSLATEATKNYEQATELKREQPPLTRRHCLTMRRGSAAPIDLHLPRARGRCRASAFYKRVLILPLTSSYLNKNHRTFTENLCLKSLRVAEGTSHFVEPVASTFRCDVCQQQKNYDGRDRQK